MRPASLARHNRGTCSGHGISPGRSHRQRMGAVRGAGVPAGHRSCLRPRVAAASVASRCRSMVAWRNWRSSSRGGPPVPTVRRRVLPTRRCVADRLVRCGRPYRVGSSDRTFIGPSVSTSTVFWRELVCPLRGVMIFYSRYQTHGESDRLWAVP